MQRKQTLFMLITAILCGLLFFFPLATIELATPVEATVVGEADGALYTIWGISYFKGGGEAFYYHGILVVLATLLPIITIFLHKKRTLQLSLCFVEGIFVLGLIGFEVIGIYRLNTMFAGTPYVVDHSFVMVVPILAIATVFFSYKGIMHDILLLRSADRIR